MLICFPRDWRSAFKTWLSVYRQRWFWACSSSIWSSFNSTMGYEL